MTSSTGPIPDAAPAVDEPVLLVTRHDRTAVLTMHRPAARNALNRALRQALTSAVHELDGDDDVDVLVLTGTDPAFSAGLDLKELGSSGLPGDRRTNDEAILNSPLPPSRKPVIGAVNGVAVTGGLELALNCDFLIASPQARFADTHARVGVMPGWGLTVLLPQAVGLRRARQMSVTGNYVDADTALAWGLVNEVVPHEQLLDRCLALAGDIASNDQLGVRQMLDTYRHGALGTVAAAYELEAQVGSRWLRDGHGSPQEIERRRAAIAARGRSQTS